MGHRASLPLVAAALVAAACGGGEVGARRDQVAAEGRDLERMMDHLEDRLLVNQARVRFWDEMRGRHESVTAVACASQEEHAEEMARRLLPEERRRSAARAAAGPERMAAASSREARRPPASGAPPFRRLAASASN